MRTKHTTVTKAADGTVTETTVEFTREIAQPNLQSRPWGVHGQVSRGVVTIFVEDEKMKHLGLYTQVARFESCVVLKAGTSQCFGGKRTHQCLSLDLDDPKVKSQVLGKKAVDIFADAALRKLSESKINGTKCTK